MEAKKVLLINPPNSNTLVRGTTPRATNQAELSDWGDYPATGVLTLASAVAAIPNVEPVYIDGVAVPYADILDYITLHRQEIAVVFGRSFGSVPSTYRGVWPGPGCGGPGEIRCR